MEADGSPPVTQRACDQCRLRKIRCDKESPCSNCRSAKRSCSSTGAGQKPKEPRQRVLISSQYERKIDLIEERLGGIETLLRNLSPISSSPLPNGRSCRPSPSGIEIFSRHQPNSNTNTLTPNSPAGSRDDETSTIFDPEDAENFEGNSSLAAHTAFASEFLENAVQRTPLLQQGTSSKIDAALSSLRQIVDMQNRSRHAAGGSSCESRWSSQKPVPRTSLKDLPLPPMTLVVDLLKGMKHGPIPVMLAMIYHFAAIDRFTDQCRRLYFNTEDVPELTLIFVNSGLAYMFFEARLSTTDPDEKVQYEAYFNMCQANLEAALTHLPLMMPATTDNIEALLMGASFNIDISRPSVAWLLVSHAAHMCRTLGLHQELSMREDAAAVRQNKALLFWCTYMLDKALSLRLGRASILQDYDVSLPRAAPDARGVAYPGREVMTLWIRHAQLQGRIYERLYSPAALRRPDALRADQVALIAADLDGLLARSTALLREFENGGSGSAAGAAGAGAADDSRMFALVLKSDEVCYLSSLALAYRAMPPAGNRSRTFSDECISVARAAMRSHQEAIKMTDDSSLKMVYIHWTILYVPFIPFIVIFCLAIETSDAEELRCLAEFVESLEAGCDVSESVSKLHQLCQVLYNVALLYVEAKAQEPVDQDMVPVGNEFDMYLSQLGFMPVDENMANVNMGVDDQTKSMTQNNQLGDWFSGNNYVMGLLEEDLSGINPMG
ncbi:hypothetical protein F4779DRAFT_588482 [Xylariaceae sp. FL0662B]|nr:hypothetical protein F4779DRAFT_588482 [Xylariaceae sp. FL0662B]